MTKTRREPTVAELKAELAQLKKARRKPGRKKMPSRTRPRHMVFYRLSDPQLAFLMKQARAHVMSMDDISDPPSRADVAKRCLLYLFESIGYKDS